MKRISKFFIALSPLFGGGHDSGLKAESLQHHAPSSLSGKAKGFEFIRSYAQTFFLFPSTPDISVSLTGARPTSNDFLTRGYPQYGGINIQLPLLKFPDNPFLGGMVGGATGSDWGNGIKNYELGLYGRYKFSQDLSIYGSFSKIGRDLDPTLQKQPHPALGVFFSFLIKETIQIKCARSLSIGQEVGQASALKILSLKFWTLPWMQGLFSEKIVMSSAPMLGLPWLILKKALFSPLCFETQLTAIRKQSLSLDFLVLPCCSINIAMILPFISDEPFSVSGCTLKFFNSCRDSHHSGTLLSTVEDYRLRSLVPIVTPPTVLKGVPCTRENFKNYIEENMELAGHSEWIDRVSKTLIQFTGFSEEASKGLVAADAHTLENFLQRQGTFFIVGPSGCGKTYTVSEICKCLEHPFIYVNAAQLLEHALFPTLESYEASHFYNNLVKTIYDEVSALQFSADKKNQYPIIFIDEMDKVVHFDPRSHLDNEPSYEDWKRWSTSWMNNMQLLMMGFLDRHVLDEKESQSGRDQLMRSLCKVMNGAITRQMGASDRTFQPLTNAEAQQLTRWLGKSVLFFAGAFQRKFEEHSALHTCSEGALSSVNVQRLFERDGVNLSVQEFIGRANFYRLTMPAEPKFFEKTFRLYCKDTFYELFTNLPKARLPKGIQTWKDLPTIQLEDKLLQDLSYTMKEFGLTTGLRGWSKKYGSVGKKIVHEKIQAYFDFKEIATPNSTRPVALVRKMPSEILITKAEFYGRMAGKN